MRTISILNVPDSAGGHTFQAVAGDRHGNGKTPGEALDAIAAQLDSEESGTLVVLQNCRPDRYFTEEQKNRLRLLMERWRSARDTGAALPEHDKAELDALVNAELQASGRRAQAIADELDE